MIKSKRNERQLIQKIRKLRTRIHSSWVCARQTKAAIGKQDWLKRPTSSPPICKGTSLLSLSYPSRSKPSLFKDLPCPVVQSHFRYRALWGAFACSVQEEERKLWFKTSQPTSLLQRKFSSSVGCGPCISFSAAVSLSGSLHRAASAFSIRSACLPDSTCTAREKGYPLGAAVIRQPPAFKAEV